MSHSAEILNTLTRICSFAPLQVERLRGDRRALWSRLPAAYQRLLQRWNGAVFEGAQLAFKTHVPFHRDGRTSESQIDAISQFYGLRPEGELPDSDLEDLLEVRARNEAEGFLPAGIISIARGLEGSLLCLSTRSEDYGAVYYWDWHWRYPWSKPFFEARIKAAEAQFADLEAIRADLAHPRRQQAEDAINYATLVPLAEDLEVWLSKCWRSTEDAPA